MTENKRTRPALTPDQWEAKDYHQSARDLDRWAEAQPGTASDDATEYVAKLGLSDSGSVIAMSGTWRSVCGRCCRRHSLE